MNMVFRNILVVVFISIPPAFAEDLKDSQKEKAVVAVQEMYSIAPLNVRSQLETRTTFDLAEQVAKIPESAAKRMEIIQRNIERTQLELKEATEKFDLLVDLQALDTVVPADQIKRTEFKAAEDRVEILEKRLSRLKAQRADPNKLGIVASPARREVEENLKTALVEYLLAIKTDLKPEQLQLARVTPDPVKDFDAGICPTCTIGGLGFRTVDPEQNATSLLESVTAKSEDRRVP
jgi:hypothetical protein